MQNLANTQCLNCGTEFNGNFCPNCSQASKTSRLTLLRLFGGDFLLGFLNLERGFLRACLELSYRPGHFANSYIEGRRKTYFNFVGLLLVLLAIEALLWSIAINSPVRYITEVIQASLVANGSELIVDEGAIESVLRNQKLFFIGVIPIAALVPFAVCRKLNYNWAEQMVAVTILLSLNTLWGILTIGLLGQFPISFEAYAEAYKFVSYFIIVMDFLLYWQLLSKGDYHWFKRGVLTAVCGAWAIGIVAVSLQLAMGFLQSAQA